MIGPMKLNERLAARARMCKDCVHHAYGWNNHILCRHPRTLDRHPGVELAEDASWIRKHYSDREGPMCGPAGDWFERIPTVEARAEARVASAWATVGAALRRFLG
mgnify:CR=1 FL=1